MVTTIPNKNIRNEASTIIGYPFADNSKVTIEIDGVGTFTMFTDKDSAWIENPAQEAGTDRRHAQGHPDGRRGHVASRHDQHRHLFAVGHHGGARGDGQGMPLSGHLLL